MRVADFPTVGKLLFENHDKSQTACLAYRVLATAAAFLIVRAVRFVLRSTAVGAALNQAKKVPIAVICAADRSDQLLV